MVPVNMNENIDWRAAVTKAQNRRDESLKETLAELPSIPDALPENVTGIPRQLLSERDLAITDQDAERLLPALASGKLSSVEVTEAFLRRAALAHKLVRACPILAANLEANSLLTLSDELPY